MLVFGDPENKGEIESTLTCTDLSGWFNCFREAVRSRSVSGQGRSLSDRRFIRRNREPVTTTSVETCHFKQSLFVHEYTNVFLTARALSRRTMQTGGERLARFPMESGLSVAATTYQQAVG